MMLSAKQRRELTARGHQLDALLTISADKNGVSPSVVDHVRKYLARRDLAKIRIRADGREVCAAAAAALARQVPCELVACIGRVALLYRPRSGTEKD